MSEILSVITDQLSNRGKILLPANVKSGLPNMEGLEQEKNNDKSTSESLNRVSKCFPPG